MVLECGKVRGGYSVERSSIQRENTMRFWGLLFSLARRELPFSMAHFGDTLAFVRELLWRGLTYSVARFVTGTVIFTVWEWHVYRETRIRPRAYIIHCWSVLAISGPAWVVFQILFQENVANRLTSVTTNVIRNLKSVWSKCTPLIFIPNSWLWTGIKNWRTELHVQPIRKDLELSRFQKSNVT